jgi:acetyltransferase-like isoleucine patch superfamily enzyme
MKRKPSAVESTLAVGALENLSNIINTGSIISHDCVLDSYVNIAPGAILAGAVSIGEGTLVGMGVTINLNVEIGDNCRVGNSSTVKSDIPSGKIVRAGSVWPE